MTDSTRAVYQAVISISVPGSSARITANILLSPDDTVATDGRLIPLRDCTLADLQAFADQIEADAWETYQDIRLIDLARAGNAVLDAEIEDEQGELLPLQKVWLEKALLLPETAVPDPEGTDEEEVDETAPAAQPIAAPEVEEIPAQPEPDEEAAITPETATPQHTTEAASIPTPDPEPTPTPATMPHIIVSEPEPVFAERESEMVETPAGTHIVPSKARVRVAGKRLPLAYPTWTAVDILIDEPALRAAQAHALSSMSREVAGVLLGPTPEKQPDGRYLVHVIDTLVAKYTVMQGASVTYTPESWRYMSDTLHERYPDDSVVMVGWYHTHPGFGIFLSGMDQFIHQNFFTQIWHIAYVLDPRARTSGFFCWDRQKTRVSRFEFHWPDWAENSW